MPEIADIVRHMTEELILAETDDIPSLNSIKGYLGRVAGYGRKNGLDNIQIIAEKAATLLEVVITGQAENVSQNLELVGRMVGILQSVIVDGLEFGSLEIPPELGIHVIRGRDEDQHRNGALTSEEATDIYSNLRDSIGVPEEPVHQVFFTDAPNGSKDSDTVRLDFAADSELVAEFINESLDHLESCDVHLLNIETDPLRIDALNAVFRAFHTIKGAAGFLGLKAVSELAHEAETLLDKGRRGEIEFVDEAVDLAFESVDALKSMTLEIQTCIEKGRLPANLEHYKSLIYRIKSINEGRLPEVSQMIHISEGPTKLLGEILVDDSIVTVEDVNEALAEQTRRRDGSLIGQILVEKGRTSASDVAKALRKQKIQSVHNGVRVKETVKVDAGRLDRLVDTIGELVIAESMVSQSQELSAFATPNMQRYMSQLDSITRELQEMATSLRMIPVAGTFHRMARLVRDLSKQIDKQINFVMKGENTELDKTVVDSIGDPLIHMIRNAVDHGIEDNPRQRINSGKPPIGTITLRAYHKGGNIYIEIEDDGRGLDRDAIRHKAMEMGLVSVDAVLSERDILNLIFEPGFTTAERLTNVSGRGVGMDVVRKNIQSLRGKVNVSSTPGRGSLFSIMLPLTLAIIDGMIIRVGRERYILPTLSIVRSLKPSCEELSEVFARGELLTVQGNLVPMFRLNRLFDLDTDEVDPTEGIIIIIENDGKQTGIVVDEVLNQQQIVIKSLGANFRNVKGISGGTIMADGTVGLILDVGGIVDIATGSFEKAA